MPIELGLVMPVYNEEECIVDVVESWRKELSRLNIDYMMIILNDGSRDGTTEALKCFAGDERITIINKENSGHGPTILLGYFKAVQMAQWVFQCDSDNEMKPQHFSGLWEKRERFDALFGVRKSRRQNFGRSFISFVSRLTVRLLFGDGVIDVNNPYRLMRSDVLNKIIEQIPKNTFAPNLIISGALAKARMRIYNHPVPHQGRKTGAVSIRKLKLWKAAMTAFLQTICCSFVIDIGKVRNSNAIDGRGGS